MKEMIEVVKTKDESGASYFENAPVKSRHTSLRAAVKSAGHQYSIFKDDGRLEFIVTKRNTDGSGEGYWTDTVNEKKELF